MIPLGIVAAAGAGGLVSTGGTIVEANGYRHHIFNSSGTFSISAARNLTIWVQDGGKTGGNGYRSSSTNANGIPFGFIVGGNGGNSGQAKYVSQTAYSGSFTVTVAGASGTSSLSTGWGAFSTHTSSGGGGGYQEFRGTGNAGAGGSGRLHTEIAAFWSGVSGMEVRSGGGGGGGSASGPNQNGTNAAAGAQGPSARGAGGQGQNVETADSAYGSISSTSGPFAGNSGCVVISFPLA